MRRIIEKISLLLIALISLPLLADDPGAATAAARLDESNRHMLWLAFGLYALVLAIYMIWSESRLRKLEQSGNK